MVKRSVRNAKLSLLVCTHMHTYK